MQADFKKRRDLTDNEQLLDLTVEWSKREIEKFQNALITIDADDFSSDIGKYIYAGTAVCYIIY